MPRSTILTALPWLACIVLFGCMSVPDINQVDRENPVTVESVIASYRDFALITPDAVLINPEIAMLCRLVTPEEAAKAVEEHGPHAVTTIMIHMNESARLAFAAKSADYPVGSVIVKRKGVHLRDDPETGVGGMIKRRPGYNPKHGDWEYFYFEKRDRVERGRLAKCVACHDRVSERDFVFGTWATPP